MKKIISIYIIIFIALLSGISIAEDNLGFGFHFGVHHNVGNYASNDSSTLYDPQNNYLIGLSCKINALFLFMRLGADTTYLINKGEILENSSSDIQSLSIHYISAPFFFGFNYPILDIGNFYMGPGLAYLMGKGKVNCSDDSLSKEINASAWAAGFITGIELNLYKSIRLYFELEYLDGRAHSVQQTQTANEWKDLHIDFTGHRILLGIIYYVI